MPNAAPWSVTVSEQEISKIFAIAGASALQVPVRLLLGTAEVQAPPKETNAPDVVGIIIVPILRVAYPKHSWCPRIMVTWAEY